MQIDEGMESRLAMARDASKQIKHWSRARSQFTFENCAASNEEPPRPKDVKKRRANRNLTYITNVLVLIKQEVAAQKGPCCKHVRPGSFQRSSVDVILRLFIEGEYQRDCCARLNAEDHFWEYAPSYNQIMH
jgi:hypothetical protein